MSSLRRGTGHWRHYRKWAFVNLGARRGSAAWHSTRPGHAREGFCFAYAPARRIQRVAEQATCRKGFLCIST